ncbi:M23 family metallopeptidase [Candidatus Uhrbacteria bacterium]|nr:M23 family metallopeptidase [Candidatus Uhrbacteria bacterium]
MVRAFLALANAGAYVLGLLTGVLKMAVQPIKWAGHLGVRVVGVPLYRGFFFLRRFAGKLHIPGRQKLVYLLTNRYAIHGLMILIVFATGVMSVQAESLRTEDFGERSMLYRMSTGGEVYDEVDVVRADAILGKPTQYLSSVAVSVQPNIDFHDFDSDYIGLTSGGSAVVANTIAQAGESIAPRTDPVDYAVQDGDTMSTIAASHGISLTTLLWANNLSVRSVIRPGDTLRILPVDGLEHTVKSGDTVLALARKYSADAEQIVTFNRLADSGDLRIGEKLMIPDGTRPAAIAVPPSSSLARALTSPRVANIVSSGVMIWPTDLRVITQYFGWRHTGLDVDCQFSNNNYAADDGIVQFAGWKGGYGLAVEVNHGNGLVTRYGHAARNYVSPGQSITKGQPIQLCGTTGRSTGTHLHFEVIANGRFQNPLAYIR